MSENVEFKVSGIKHKQFTNIKYSFTFLFEEILPKNGESSLRSMWCLTGIRTWSFYGRVKFRYVFLAGINLYTFRWICR